MPVIVEGTIYVFYQMYMKQNAKKYIFKYWILKHTPLSASAAPCYQYVVYTAFILLSRSSHEMK